MEKTIEIPEGYEARIEGNKVILEPKESEDERMLRVLREGFNILDKDDEWYNGITNGQIFAWLEKQGQHKPVISDEAIREGVAHFGITQYQISNWLKKYIDIEKQGSQNLANSEKTCKVEPKFKVGDWITNGIDVDKIIGIDLEDENYLFKNGGKSDISLVEGISHIWTIQNAKDGDVLVASDGSILLFRCVVDAACKHYVALTTDNVVKFNEGLKHYWETSRAVHPATKEQRDLLFQKMKEAGYEWDAEKKELRKIEHYPAWSEEDERHKNTIIRAIHGAGNITPIEGELAEKWLKLFIERCTWKPSDEQMKALGKICEWISLPTAEILDEIRSLYNELKKLK